MPRFPRPSVREPLTPPGPLYAAVTGGVAIACAVLVLIGWTVDFPVFKSILPHIAHMKPFSALALLCLGVAVVVSVVRRPAYVASPARVWTARALASVALVIGGSMLAEQFTSQSAAIVLLAAALLTMDSRSATLRWLSQGPALLASVISFVAVLGYFYGAEQLYQISTYTAVSLHSPLLSAMLGVAILLLRPDRSIISEFFSHHHGGLMARRVLPLAILIPMVVGWVRLQGQRAGWYGTEVGLALYAASNVVIFSVLIWFAARLLNRVDAERRGADFRRLRALREAETRWRALIEASAQIVWTTDARGVPDDSPSMRAFTGQSVEQLRTDGMSKVVHPEDLARIDSVWRHAIATRMAFESEFRLWHVSREWRWVAVRAVPIEPTVDSHVAWVGMNHDITDRKLGLALAEGQKQVLEMIARGAPLSDTLDALVRLIEAQADDMFCSILVMGPDGKHLHHGAAPRLPESYSKIIDGVAIGAKVGSCGTAAFTRQPVFVEDIAVDPLWEDYKHLALPHGLRACWSTPIIDAGGQVLGTFAMYYTQPALPLDRHLRLIDLATHTAAICLIRHSQVQALRDSERRFRQLAESLPQLVWTCRADGYCDYISRQWLDYTGMPNLASMGHGWTEQIHPADREACLKAWNTAIEAGTDYQVELRLRRHDGIYRWFDARATPQRDEQNRVVKWVGSNTDIDDRKRFEETQLRSQKLESLGTLAGGIAHDFNNMLLVIQGNAQLAQEMISAESPAQEHLVEISHASDRATDLVRRILSFSRPQKARHKVISLGPVVDEALKFARATLSTSIELRAKVASQVPIVAADATQIHQILLNLATNGAHAIGPRSGLIEVELAGVDIDAEAVACALDNVTQLPPGRYARLTVRDNGCGMSPDVLERIFDPFFTTKPVGQGTGLGLSIVHGIMRSSGGAVTVQSELGKGTSFHLYFPAAATPSQADTTGVHQALLRGANQRVLFIDDEDSVVRLATLNLTRMGYRVTGCTEPSAALKEFNRDPGAFDAVVTDLSMPGMTGFDCAREILAVRPELPIVMTSGYIRPEDEALAREIGIRMVCSKPEALRELGELLTQVLATHAADASSTDAAGVN